MLAALIACGTAAAAALALLAWLAHAALTRGDRAARSEVATAQLRADLQLAQADAAAYRQAHADQVAVTRRLEEVTRHAVAQLVALDPDAGAHGLDRLQAALAVTAVPAVAAGDRPATGEAGLPGGAGPAAGRSDPGPAGGDAPVPPSGRIADVLK